MGRQKLCLGVLLGAMAGGLAALYDQETRYYTKNKLSSVKSTANYYVKHPSEAIRNAKDACNQLNASFNHNADNAINALEQVEETVNKISKKEEPKKLETTM
ncbi:YtxH domain-containing protein [Virgibacillus sp. FSP13]